MLPLTRWVQKYSSGLFITLMVFMIYTGSADSNKKGQWVPALLLDPCFSFWTGVKHAHCSESRKGGCSVGSAWLAEQLFETRESCEEAAFDAKLPVSCESVLCEIQLHDNSTGCIHVFNRKGVFDSLLRRQCNRLSPPSSPHSKMSNKAAYDWSSSTDLHLWSKCHESSPILKSTVITRLSDLLSLIPGRGQLCGGCTSLHPTLLHSPLPPTLLPRWGLVCGGWC